MSSEPRKDPTASQAIDFFHLLFSLKQTKRTGWVKRGVKAPESIADHMYRMGMMAMFAGEAGVDAGRAIKVALVHDVAEAIVGDIAPGDGVSDADKYAREAAAMERIREMLGGQDVALASEVVQLWREYEDQATPEAVFVKDLDKLEMILQAHEYEAEQDMALQEFFDSTRGKFKTDVGKRWAEEICRRRDERRSS
ncbi:unnamed protein product [Pedinophyceae sp. YPF-701]|nr:unnamed protein product [Pedinophyceae sp. YPF-701]